MTFDAQAIFANLAEKERIHGHHSPEGSGHSHAWPRTEWIGHRGIFPGADVIVLCDQAIADWLKRLNSHGRRGIADCWKPSAMTELLESFIADDKLMCRRRVATRCVCMRMQTTVRA